MLLFWDSAYADFSNALYARAHGEYVREEWSAAASDFEAYQAADREFLTAHPEESKRISDAIAYCRRHSYSPKFDVKELSAIAVGEMASPGSTVTTVTTSTSTTKVVAAGSAHAPASASSGPKKTLPRGPVVKKANAGAKSASAG